MRTLLLVVALSLPSFGQGILAPIMQGPPATSSTISVANTWHNHGIVAGPGSIAVTVSPTAGNTLIAAVADYRGPGGGTGATITVDDGHSHSFTADNASCSPALPGGAGRQICYFHLGNIASGLTAININTSYSGTDVLSAVIVELAGCGTGCSKDAMDATGGFANPGTTWTTGGVTTTAAGAIVFGMAYCENSTQTLAGASPWNVNQVQFNDAGFGDSTALVWVIETTTGTDTPNGTLAGGVAKLIYSLAASYKP